MKAAPWIHDAVIVAPAMRDLARRVDLFAASELSVLVLGETGVGKELVAERIHRRSRRGARPLITVNCASLTESRLHRAEGPP